MATKLDLLESILDAFIDEQLIIAEGFDEAVIGIDENSYRIIYSKSKCINILMKEHEMSEDDAIEYFDFNVSGSYVGEKTPIFCNDLF